MSVARSIVKLLTGAALLVALASPLGSEEGVLFVIHPEALLPSQSLVVTSDEVVIWLNDVPGRLVEITFQEPVIVSPDCPATQQFHQTQGDFLASGALSPGAMASLCFSTEGRYPFLVSGLQKELSGEVVVRKAEQ